MDGIDVLGGEVAGCRHREAADIVRSDSRLSGLVVDLSRTAENYPQRDGQDQDALVPCTTGAARKKEA